MSKGYGYNDTKFKGVFFLKVYRSKLLFIVVMALLFLMVACTSNSNTGQNAEETKDANKHTITIGLNNWAENIAVSNMWKVILEEEGYEVKLTNGEKAIIYTGVNKGELDLGLEVWLPYTDEPYYNQYKEGYAKIGPWYEGTGLGLVVPSYVNVNSIAELNDKKDMFNSQIIGIEPGTSIMRMTEEAIEVYGLDYNLIGSSETAMLASLKSHYDEQKPILVTLWNPHWVFAEYDLKYLEDPEKIYGDEEAIYAIANKNFADNNPEIVKWLSQWKMDDQSLGDLMSTINEVGDPAEGAKIWVNENRSLVEQWLE